MDTSERYSKGNGASEYSLRRLYYKEVKRKENFLIVLGILKCVCVVGGFFGFFYLLGVVGLSDYETMVLKEEIHSFGYIMAHCAIGMGIFLISLLSCKVVEYVQWEVNISLRGIKKWYKNIRGM